MSSSQLSEHLTPGQLEEFRNSGFLILRGCIPADYVNQIRQISFRQLSALEGDIEFEADLNYPGAPVSHNAPGGQTVRRLRQAISRDPIFLRLVREPFLLGPLQQLLGPSIVMPLAHHNCIMTKQPQFSSDTGWHQDIRYWSFSTPELINAWIALGAENAENGCLQLLPGTHRQHFEQRRFDEEKFLRTDLEENRAVLNSAIRTQLAPGDLLLFHARCFHSATRNYSDTPKLSAVFTFRAADNVPLPGTRSDELPELLLS